ncbi:hypothetical protein MKK88_13180 [Methylobacterium sp. E-005]|uniref:hypothetical protein n=1 Tax=Methylobacterium sp. E-005 TaxID=2836549 RepID=UPI001FBA6C87|nr:hypothetical protein [Methylobacterium sp. E-005]MCJ2086934.1 hypothetical protein [Methylobacterium sp. E-005]
MSITPYRDAAAATVAATRQHFAEQGPADSSVLIARRMDVDVTEAAMLGYADLRDLAVPQARSVSIVARVMASAIASLAATVCGGRQDASRLLLDVLLGEIRHHALDRIARVEHEAFSASVSPSQPRGRA